MRGYLEGHKWSEQMKVMDDWREFAPFWSGGDERIAMDDRSDRNRYHVNPFHTEGLLYRGSCTCGVLSRDTEPVARAAMERLGADAGSDWSEEQRERLRGLVDSGQPMDIFFGPSGTDLLYLPLLLARALADRDCISVVSCPEELGGGSVLAAAGRYFSHTTATGAAVEHGGLLDPALAAEVIQLQARSADGRIRDRQEEIKRCIAAHPDKTVIVHLVFGSKSGIRDDLEVIAPMPGVLWTVDLCQFRADPDLIGTLLEKGAMVLITGSKFYQAPPFCGALLVPRTLTDGVVTWPESARALGSIYVQSDIPARLASLREALPVAENAGSRLRWECALWQMEACGRHPRGSLVATIGSWNQVILEEIAASPHLTLIPDQAQTNDSIVSFRVTVGGRYLDRPQMDRLFEALTTRNWHAELGWDRLFIGQPVSYGDRAFIRVALGAQATRMALENGADWEDDRRMMRLIARTAQELHTS